MEKKMTKVDMFNLIKTEVSANTEMVDFINHEIELLKKKSVSKTSTKGQKETQALRPVVVDVLGNITEGTVTEVSLADERLSLTNGVTTQKISAVLKTLIDDGLVKKETKGKKAIFSLVE